MDLADFVCVLADRAPHGHVTVTSEELASIDRAQFELTYNQLTNQWTMARRQPLAGQIIQGEITP